MPTIEENRYWNDRHHWREEGHEWKNQAAFSNQNYETWLMSLVDTFISGNIDKDSNVLEIGAGHGRFTDFLFKAKRITLVDLNENCITFCKKRFRGQKNIIYHVNDGKSLPFIKDHSIDFIWSYDSFVHMEKDIIQGYLKEFSRVLKHGGKAIIHHAGRNNYALSFVFLKKFGRVGRIFYKLLSLGKLKGSDGWRSDVSKEMVRDLAKKQGLSVLGQVNSWGERNQFTTRLFNDYISKIVKQ